MRTFCGKNGMTCSTVSSRSLNGNAGHGLTGDQAKIEENIRPQCPPRTSEEQGRTGGPARAGGADVTVKEGCEAWELLEPKLLILPYANPGSPVEASCSLMRGASTAVQKKQISFLDSPALRCAKHAVCGSTFPSSFHISRQVKSHTITLVPAFFPSYPLSFPTSRLPAWLL